VNKMQSQVAEFHKTFGVPVHTMPQVAIGADRALLRAKLIFEEAKETIEAMGCLICDYTGYEPPCNAPEIDIVEIADGLADLMYVINGAALEFGIDLEPIFNAVHSNNMAKVWTVEEVESNAIPEGFHAEEIDGLFGWRVMRPDGKILKPPSHKKVNIESVLAKQA